MTSYRRGFTLLELLVVIAIIGVLLGLLLPAIQQVRSSAARTQCQNNVKQLGLALHIHHDSNTSLPPGISSGPPNNPYIYMTWLSCLLPYIEQGPLWRATLAAYDYQPLPYLNPPHIGFGMPIRLFSCPADGRVASPQNTHHGLRPALTSYVGVLGTSYQQMDGVLYLNSHVRFLEITDGLSSTLLIGERPPSADFWYGWWYAGYGQGGSGSGDMLLGVRERNFGGAYVESCPPGPYHFVPGRFDRQCDLFHYWGPHTGGANFLLADGSVHFLTYSVDGLLPALATRAGGEVVTSPD